MSDQAAFTGMDDGNATKTINITLKDDKKNGLFGKLNTAEGTDGRYAEKGNVNLFNPGNQLSVIGALNNINDDVLAHQGLTGSPLQRSSKQESNIPVFTTANSILTSGGGGANLNNFKDEKKDIHVDYLYTLTSPLLVADLHRQFLLPDTSWLYNQHQQASSTVNGHAFNFSIDQKINDKESVKTTASLNLEDTRINAASAYNTLDENGTRANDGFSNNNIAKNGYRAKVDFLYRKKLSRPGRTFSVALSLQSGDLTGTGQLSSQTNFYRSGFRYLTDTINQQSGSGSKNVGFTLRSVYTQPLFNSSLIEIGVSSGGKLNNDSQQTYDLNPLSGKYDALNQLLSNNFRSTNFYDNADIRWLTSGYKTFFSIGTVIQQTDLYSEVLDFNKNVLYNGYLNLLPNAKFKYTFNKYKSITLTYVTAINLPASYQLQPLIDNTDPLNVIQGNPDLKPEYNHTLQFVFSTSHPYNGNSLRMNLSFTDTKNKIINADSINSTGIKKSIPVNRNGNYNIFAAIDASCKLKAIKSYLSLDVYGRFSNNIQLTNGIVSDTKDLNIQPELRLTCNPTENLDLTLNALVEYDKAVYSVQPTLSNSYFKQQYDFDIIDELPGNWVVSSNFSYIINTGRAPGFNSSFPLLAASISRFILKNNRGEVRLSVSDALNKNVSTIRNITQSYIEDSHTQVLRRYFMLGFVYSLTRVGLRSTNN